MTFYHDMDLIDVGRSREGAWIEIEAKEKFKLAQISRSREGAWIEIRQARQAKGSLNVAPARERGLKLIDADVLHRSFCRSREGAWIEIYQRQP